MNNLNIEQQMDFYNVKGCSIISISNRQIKTIENIGTIEVDSHRKVDEHSIFNACSISKFLTGMLVLKLVSDGILDLDEDVNEKLQSWKVSTVPSTIHKRVTLRNLLSHQSGIQDPVNSFSELLNLKEVPTMVEILNGTSQYCREAIVSNATSQNEFHYSDAGYCIIEQLITDVVGKPFHQVVCEHIFEPLHMENSFLNPKLLLSNTSNIAVGHNKMGEIVNGKYPVYPYPAASGLWTTSENLAKLCIEFMNSLNEASTIGLSKTLAEEMIHPQGGKSWTGLGVFLEGTGMDLEISSLGWGLGFQSMVMMLPHRNKGAVILTNSELGVHQMEGFIGEVYKSLF